MEKNYNDYKNELIQDILMDNFSQNQLISLWNDMCNDKCNTHYIYDMEEFDSIMSDYTPTEIVRLIMNNTDFDADKDYFSFSNGDIETFELVEEYSYFCIHELSDYLIKSKWDKLKYYEKEFMEEIVRLCNDKNGCAANVLEDIKAFGFVNVITDDWNDLIGLINKLIGK